MMDPYNLAICFGPTLVPVPDDKDQVQYQNQVNDLIKNIIVNYEEIFPNDGGCIYEKYISAEPDDQYVEIFRATIFFIVFFYLLVMLAIHHQTTRRRISIPKFTLQKMVK